jgi:glycosyltransferase involved in cell wall biosynthesis
LRRARGAWVLKRCDYAVGWAEGSTRIARRLAPGLPTETFPATGVSVPNATERASPDEWFGRGSADLPKLAFVGRFAPEKGIDDFLRICDELARRRPIRVAVAGGDSTYRAVREWIANRSWASLHGVLPRTSVSSLFASSDVLVCPSRTTTSAEEQFGKAAVEAMAVGTPVFAYDCGALAEVIGPGGVVVPEGDERQLVDRLEQYFANRSTSLLSAAARSRATDFTDSMLAEKLIDLWGRFVERPSLGATG